MYDLSTQRLRGYGDKITDTLHIPEDSKLLTRKYNFIILVGNLSRIDKLPRLKLILSNFHITPALINGTLSLIK